MQKYIIVLLVLLSTMVHANFNFGECSGSGTFEQQIVHYGGDYENAATVGTIPAGIQGLKISLVSDRDVDIRLYGENDDKIVHWPYGILSKSKQATKPYQDINITYSGYNGVGGEKGHEFIEVVGTTPIAMTMKAFGYQYGYATVNYSWMGKEGCNTENNATQSEGSFTQVILAQDTILVGTIPPNIDNLKIQLTSNNDIDIQLYSADGTAIVSWQPQGLLFGATTQSIVYHDMNITWSGYNGTNGQAGNEYIKISGKTSEMLVLKVFGYEAGEANVTYSWGESNNTNTEFLTGAWISSTGNSDGSTCSHFSGSYASLESMCDRNTYYQYIIVPDNFTGGLVQLKFFGQMADGVNPTEHNDYHLKLGTEDKIFGYIDTPYFYEYPGNGHEINVVYTISKDDIQDGKVKLILGGMNRDSTSGPYWIVIDSVKSYELAL